MNDYVIFGLDNLDLRKLIERGLPVRYRIVFSEEGRFKYLVGRMTKLEARKWKKEMKKHNRAYNTKYSIFLREEFEAA